MAPTPVSGPTSRHYKRLGRYAAALALLSDAALASMGGELKRREMLSARLGDILSELYLLSAVLKRWEDEGRCHPDLPLVHWCMHAGCARIEARIDQVLANLPMRPLAWVLRAIVLPLRFQRGPSDALTRECAELLLAPSATRDRLMADLHRGQGDDSLAKLERAFDLVVSAQPLHDLLRKAGLRDWRDAHRAHAITDEQAALIEAAEQAVADVVGVDDFDPQELVQKG